MKVDRECPVCGALFQVWASRVEYGRGVHCSKNCQSIAMREKMAKPKVALVCIGCGGEFERLQSSIDNHVGGGKFCSRECRDANWKGAVTPNWQGGSGVYKRGPHWQSIKRSILKRDNYECQNCGNTGDLHVHHKTPFRMFEDADQANQEDNLVSLCPPCHRKEDAKYKWVKVDGATIRLDAGGAEWRAVRKNIANDNANKRDAA